MSKVDVEKSRPAPTVTVWDGDRQIVFTFYADTVHVTVSQKMSNRLVLRKSQTIYYDVLADSYLDPETALRVSQF